MLGHWAVVRERKARCPPAVVGWSVDSLAGWLAGWLTGWLVSWLVSCWLAGWLMHAQVPVKGGGTELLQFPSRAQMLKQAEQVPSEWTDAREVREGVVIPSSFPCSPYLPPRPVSLFALPPPPPRPASASAVVG